MASRALKICQYTTTLPHGRNVSVKAAVQVALSHPELFALPEDDLVRALTSGEIWTIRGKSCHIAIQIDVDDSILHCINSRQILQFMADQLQRARMWSQLYLSIRCAWSISPQGSPVFVIHIEHDHAASPTEIKAADIEVPSSILTARFESLNLVFRIRGEAGPSTRMSQSGLESIAGNPDGTLLDSPIISPDVFLEDDARFGLSCRDSSPLLSAASGVLKTTVVIPSVRNVHSPAEKDLSEDSEADLKARGACKKDNGRLSRWVVEILALWLKQNLHKPYPNSEQKKELVRQTGLRLSQLNRWFYDQRRKRNLIYGSIPGDRQEMPLSTCPPRPQDTSDDAYTHDHIATRLSLLEENDSYDEEMLLLGVTQVPPMSWSQSQTTESTICDHYPFQMQGSSSSQIGNGSEERESFTLTICPLAMAALQTIMFGTHDRRNPAIRPCQPKASLAQMVPSMFSPGYSNTVAANVGFLSRISSTICSSMVRNAQSPSLKGKLLALAESEESGILHINHVGNENHDVETRLSRVVQSRLWGMIQRKSFDPRAVRKVEFGGEDATQDEDDEDQGMMLLDELEGSEDDGDINILDLLSRGLQEYVSEEFAVDGEEDLLEEMLV